MAGMVHECRTSAAVIRVRIWELKGMTVWLSVSRRRVFKFLSSLDGIIYESNSRFIKSEYS